MKKVDFTTAVKDNSIKLKVGTKGLRDYAIGPTKFCYFGYSSTSESQKLKNIIFLEITYAMPRTCLLFRRT